MAKPQTRTLLLLDAEREKDALAAMLGGMTREQLMWPGAYGWSAKDIVAHLAEWERMLLGWYDAGLRGELPPVPAAGYGWGQLGELNQRIYEQHRDDQLEHVLADWRDGSRRLIQLANATSEVDLFTIGRFPWTGRGSLASFVNECGPNHYRWGAREIKQGLRVRR